MSSIIFALLGSFIISAILGPIIIPMLKNLKFGQSILEIGPKWHSGKSGTPTMGGIIFIIGAIVATVSFVRDVRIIILLLASIMFGAIGFVDDYIKVVLKRNLGLTALQKLSAQALTAIVFSTYLYYSGFLDGEILIPFTNIYIVMEPIFFIPFTVLVMLGTVNSVNLTDGLDGLAAGITTVVAVFFAIVAYSLNDYSISIFSSTIVGGCIGFLIFNLHPAKVFMGDTGSLFLGGAISAIAVILKLPLILLIVGGVYLFEALSVIIQVTSFKLTGKRIFKMSPIHHHFEMIGWKETKVVRVFVGVTVILAVIAYLGV